MDMTIKRRFSLLVLLLIPMIVQAAGLHLGAGDGVLYPGMGHGEFLLEAAVALAQDGGVSMSSAVQASQASHLYLARSEAAAVQEEEIPIAFITVAEVNRLIEEGTEVKFVDVRSPKEYWARHIPGAVSIPVNSLPRRAAEIPRQGLVVLY
jgi:Rhodanese-like domain